MQTRCFKVSFLLFLIITFIAGLVGFVGNNLLNAGLIGTTGLFVYEMARNIETVERVLGSVVSTPVNVYRNEITQLLLTLGLMFASMLTGAGSVG